MCYPNKYAKNYHHHSASQLFLTKYDFLVEHIRCIQQNHVIYHIRD